jgi:hypothetical protein
MPHHLQLLLALLQRDVVFVILVHLYQLVDIQSPLIVYMQLSMEKRIL